MSEPLDTMRTVLMCMNELTCTFEQPLRSEIHIKDGFEVPRASGSQRKKKSDWWIFSDVQGIEETL